MDMKLKNGYIDINKQNQDIPLIENRSGNNHLYYSFKSNESVKVPT